MARAGCWMISWGIESGDPDMLRRMRKGTTLNAIEQAVRKAEEDEWKRTDPEARQRAEETVAMLSAEIDKLAAKAEKAEARGDQQAANKAQDSIATYQTWLDQAKATLADFTR